MAHSESIDHNVMSGGHSFLINAVFANGQLNMIIIFVQITLE